ncbi:MAG: DNA polymerase IV [Puniceicoccales bacterium]|jgi:DNA polymerase-4|nr:DNA polymerase IV [Puniceicoccales bacterium]
MPCQLPTIVHLDADAFFVAVEQALNPSLLGKKVAVGGRVRGIIASASYEARACGVYTPMPTNQALRVCPDLVLVDHGDGMRRYSEFSRKLFAMCEAVTPVVERRSIDEGFMDVTLCGFADVDSLVGAMRGLQARIREELGLPVSFGLATNKLVSAIASKQQKPFGFTVVLPREERAFLAPLPVNVLPGVGKKTEVLLKANGIVRVEDLFGQTDSKLAALFGRDWRQMLAGAQGEDESLVGTVHEGAKSFSRQETFSEDCRDFQQVLRVAKGMLDELMSRVRVEGKRVRTLTVKVRYPGMQDDVAGRSLAEASDLEASFYVLLENLLQLAWRRRSTPVRLVMVKLSGMEDPDEQLELFPQQRDDDERQRRLAAAVDALNARPHGALVRRGHQVLWAEDRRKSTL